MVGRCCRYFDPQPVAKTAGYPYPFSPSTHLYRDRMEGFVSTVRAALKSRKPPRTLHYLHEIIMDGEGSPVVAGGEAPPALADDLAAIKAALLPVASLQPFFGGFANAKVWMGQRGIIMPLHYDATDNLYVMAWGRKRVTLAEPGQLDALYRYPNAHPLAGSSQVNLSAPDLSLHPRFANAKLREAVVGPGDVLYLPSWWWHQFEQPFENAGNVNLWSRNREGTPDRPVCDLRVREHSLSDHLERAAMQSFGRRAGVVLEALARRGGAILDQLPSGVSELDLERANSTLHAAAEAWIAWARDLPGGTALPVGGAAEAVAEYLILTHHYAVAEGGARLTSWEPGVEWDLSRLATLPATLRARCRTAPASSSFFSVCE